MPKARILEFPLTRNEEPLVRVDFHFLITRRRPFAEDDMYRRLPTGPVDYGMMLAQQLRLRVAGIGIPEITGYGLTVTHGAIYDVGQIKKRIRTVTEQTLAMATPWILHHRSPGTMNWSLHFGEPLKSGQALTCLGQEVAERFMDAGRVLKPTSVYRHYLFLNDVDRDGDADHLSVMARTAAQQTAGTRQFPIEWEEGGPQG